MFQVNLWLFYGILASFISFVLGSNILNVEVEKSSPLVLTSPINEKWNYCSWTHNGVECDTTIDSSNEPCKIDPNRIKWIKNDASGRACSINITSAQMSDVGYWRCLLLPQKTEFSYNITVNEKTSINFGGKPFKEMLVGEMYKIECSARGGSPQSNIFALVGKSRESFNASDDKILERLDDSILKNPDSGIITMSSVFRYVPQRSDQKMFVKCAAVQRNYKGKEIFPPIVTAQPFNLAFRPLPVETPVEKFFVNEGQDAEVTITFYAFPAPSQIVWNFVREEPGMSETVVAGSSSGRFEAKNPIFVVDDVQRFGEVSTTLIIRQISIDDLKAFKYLEVSNIHGRNQFNFEFGLKSDQPDTDEGTNESNETDETSNSMFIIIGVVLVVVLALIIVSVIVVVMYKNGQGCFKNTRFGEKSEYFSVEANDTEMKNMNAQATKPTGTSQEPVCDVNKQLASNQVSYFKNPQVDNILPETSERSSKY